MKELRAVFSGIKSRFDQQKSGRDGLVCKQGFYKNCLVLKLQKPSWTNDPMDQIRNESGIFFSIWIAEESANPYPVNYNIHALKLRQKSNSAFRRSNVLFR